MMDGDKHKNELFERIYAEHYETVYKYVLVSLNFDYPSADDCIQDILTLLLQKIDKVIQHPNPGGFLIVTAKNYIKKYKTANAKNLKKTTPLDENLHELSYEEDLDNIFKRTADVDMLKAEILKRLSNSEMSIYEMFYEKKLSVAEISKNLHISEGNVKVRLFRLRAKVKNAVYEIFL